MICLNRSQQILAGGKRKPPQGQQAPVETEERHSIQMTMMIVLLFPSFWPVPGSERLSTLSPSISRSWSARSMILPLHSGGMQAPVLCPSVTNPMSPSTKMPSCFYCFHGTPRLPIRTHNM
jgi:hypothetical protein